jgi:hypothetical protein
MRLKNVTEFAMLESMKCSEKLFRGFCSLTAVPVDIKVLIWVQKQMSMAIPKNIPFILLIIPIFEI